MQNFDSRVATLYYLPRPYPALSEKPMSRNRDLTVRARSTPVHGVCVLLAMMAMAMLAVASRIEQPRMQLPAADLSTSLVVND